MKKNETKVKAVVKWFNDSKGYGFLDTADRKDVFVHYSAIKGDGFKTLAEGQEVLCIIIDGPKGSQAADVTRIDQTPEAA
jgi:CspA family cold shock protein